MSVRTTIVGFSFFLLVGWLSGCGASVSTPQEKGEKARTQVQGSVGEEQRPMIWVRPAERPAILAKIAENPAVAAYYAAFSERVKKDMSDWATAPSVYLNRLPLVEVADESFPSFRTYTEFGGTDGEEQDRMMHQLQTAVDCGVLYFLTQEEQYARYAADVLHTFVSAIHQMPLDTESHNAGWVYTEDHLREAREISAQLPIIYDFIQPWLLKDGRVYDLGKRGEVAFDFDKAEDVFRGYAELAITRGGTGTNWPILEAASLVGNALALRDPTERAHYLKFFLEEDTRRQDALPTISAFYKEYGGSWPESFGYSQHVGEFLTYLFAVLSHHDPTSKLVDEYPQVMAALPEAYYFTYPGGEETILHGDGHREYHPMINGYEMAYHLGKRENRPELIETFGPLIKHSVQSGDYRRFKPPGRREYPASPYREPTKLLWFEPEVATSAGEYPLPVTDEMPFAGITLQRNLSPSGKAEDGLMGFVGGGAYVHGHATGMSMELFGRGFVLGGKGGRKQYRTDIHENYYRITASNNTVIVNGATTSAGGWVNLGQDRVKRLSVEPALDAAPVSPNYSFSTSAFHDTVGTAAEAYQERTLGIVRTTDSTGYYVDVFRSRSKLEPQYHDYIYRNVGEGLRLTSDGQPVSMTATPERFQAKAKTEWRRNRAYRHPGWHFFDDVNTSGRMDESVRATFRAKKLTDEPVEMRAFIPGSEGRTYTSAQSPPFTEGPKGYRDKPAPTLVVRQEGEAWDRPFAVVYEPVSGGRNSVASVEAIWRERRCQGMVVKSNARAGGITQLVLTPADPEEEVALPDYDLRFRGRYAVITYSAKNELQSIYLGDGNSLSVGGYALRSSDGASLAASVLIGNGEPEVTTTAPLFLRWGSGAEREYLPPG